MIADLQQVAQSLPASASATAGAASGDDRSAAGNGDGRSGSEDDEEVVDAEFTRD
jgi:hypothetical protein